MSVMTIERIRLTFDVPDPVRRALNIIAARRASTVGEVIAELVQDNYPDAVAEANKAIAEGQRPKRGRRPNPKDGGA